MPARLAFGIACILMLSGCEKPTDPTATTPDANAPPDQAASPGSSQVGAPEGGSEPVATLLGKPVYRDDCLSRSSGVGSVETGIYNLVLGELINDFCDPTQLTLSEVEIDAFWQTLQAQARRANDNLPETPPFDESKIQARLDKTRGKLAASELSWHERMTLEEQERGLLFALEHKTVAAEPAYTHLMPMRRKAALYKKYGGKVVAMQVSIEPVGAYVKLVQEAEANGKLLFHDDALKQAFWKRMNEYMERRGVPPEGVDFSLPVWLQFATRDSKPIDELCRQARGNLVEKRFDQLASSVWRDQFIHCSFDQDQPIIAAFDEAMRDLQDRVEAFDEIAPHPASTQFEIQAPVAVVRLPMVSCRKGELASPVEYLAIAARQHGAWRIAAAVRGNWKLTEADRFNPRNEDHRALQAFYDRLNQVIIDEDADGLRDVCRPLFRLIWPGSETDRAESAFIGDREDMVSGWQDHWQQSDFQKHHHKVVFAKVIGPLALTLAQGSYVADDGPEEKGKCLQFFCRDGDQWKSCLWMPGDWQKIFMAK